MSNSDAPYISVVATSRNDDHGGDMRKRMNIFVNGLIHQCDKYKFPCELLIVDWNSEDENQLLESILPKPGKDSYLRIRYVVVPPTIHNSMQYSDKMGLFQMIAKNVGIRRAKAEFILCTNVDLLFSDQLFERFIKRDLKKGKFYRANRCDIPNDIDENLDVELQLQFCKDNIQKRLGRYPEFPIFDRNYGLFIKYKIFSPLLPILSNIKKKMMGEEKALFHALDFDACGDFTMMSREDWEKIDGYVELEMYSLHIDSMGLFSAAAKGIEQEIFPMDACTYHIAHTGGWEFADPIEKLAFFSKKPSLEWWAVWQAGLKIVREKSNFNFNSENWGLNNVDLKEIEIE